MAIDVQSFDHGPFQPSICAQCRADRQRTARRHVRSARRDELRVRLASVIPPLFRAAHLRHLGAPFREELLEFSGGGLVLTGPVGRGKSFAVCALLRHFLLMGKTARRITYEMFCMDIRAAFKGNSKLSEKDVMAPYIRADYVAMEDLGTRTAIDGRESEFSRRTFLCLLDTRIEACRPTFITTNKTRENLDGNFDDRIASRLGSFKWIVCGGCDLRRQKLG